MPYIVQTQPGTPRWGDYLGQGFASGADKGLDFLLKALLEGQLAKKNTGGVYTPPLSGMTQTGRITPGGQSYQHPTTFGPTFISPEERLASNPNIRLSDLIQQQVVPSGIGQFTPTITQGGGYQLQPNLTRQLQQSEIAKNTAQAKALNNPSMAYRLDATGNAVPIVTPEGNPVSSKTKIVGAGTTTAQSDIQDVVDGIKEGRIPPNPQELSYRDKTRVRAELSRQGVNLSKLETDWNVMQTYAKNANSTQQVRMRQALESVRQGIGTLGNLSSEFNRTGWTPSNAAVVKAAMTGTDPTRRDQATRFITQMTVMKDELAQGFMGGGVPTDRALQLADDVLNPLYGAKQLDAALDQLNTNLSIRLNAINAILPVTMGQTSSQYQGMMGAGSSALPLPAAQAATPIAPDEEEIVKRLLGQ